MSLRSKEDALSINERIGNVIIAVNGLIQNPRLHITLSSGQQDGQKSYADKPNVQMTKL